MKKQYEFWITNISTQKDISLSDLRLTIRKGESRNLLDTKHYHYTLEELQKSAKSGSIFTKSNVIKIRDIPPTNPIIPGIYKATNGRYIRQLRSSVKIIEPKFEELDFTKNTSLKASEEKFAADNIDLDMDERAPALPVDKIYKNKSRDTSEDYFNTIEYDESEDE